LSEQVPVSILKHRRQIRRQIVLPVLVPAMLFVGMAIVLFILAMRDDISGQQIGVVAACMTVLFIFIPLFLFLLVADFVLLFLAFGAGGLHGLLTKPLAFVRDTTGQLAAFTQTISGRITAPIINLRVRVARWRYIIWSLLSNTESEAPDESE
jgi:hypothetical protein